jgi:hypothetical protein
MTAALAIGAVQDHRTETWGDGVGTTLYDIVAGIRGEAAVRRDAPRRPRSADSRPSRSRSGSEIGPLCGRKRQGLNYNDHSSIFRVCPISEDIALQLIWQRRWAEFVERGIETAGNSANPVSTAKTA